MQFHAVVWLDHKESKVYYFNRDTYEKKGFHSSNNPPHLHHKSGAVGCGRQPEDQAFYHQIAEALKEVREILVVGPSYAKREFINHVQHHDGTLSDRIAAFSTMDKATDAEVVAFARKFFKAYDKLIS